MRKRSFAYVALFFLAMTATALPVHAQVKPGDMITKANCALVQNLVSPGNFQLVRQGMEMHIVPSDKIEWPPPFKAATEKYSAQVSLAPDGSLKNYVAGLPFPLVDPLDANDPQLATKIMWNFSFKPLYSDDVDLRDPEIAGFSANSNGVPGAFLTVGHFSFYNNVGRIEVPPIPTDPDATKAGIRYRFGFYPVFEPPSIQGWGLLRYRYINPHTEDNVFVYQSRARRMRRITASTLSDMLGAVTGFVVASVGGGGADLASYASTVDPDSFFGFSAKIEDYDYKFIGEKQMLASVHAKNSPAIACKDDGGRTICPEDWEMRRIYVIDATAKPHQNLTIPKRILYIDSESWVITASDQYDREGQLWKTIATFQTYRDRPVPDARVAIYPYKRIFQIGLVDEDLTNGGSSVIYMPGPQAEERECWYIDMGTVKNNTFIPQALINAGH